MDPEKTKKEGLIRRLLANDKLVALITFVSAAVGFSLSLVALLSGGGNGELQNYEVVMLNTSTILQNAIKVESASSVTARALLPVQSGIPTPVVKERDLSLPGVSEISSFFASISSDLTPQSTGTASTGSTSGSGLLGDLESFITDVFGNVTNAAGTEVANVANTLVGDVVSALGVKQWYALYMTEYCEGYYEPSYSTPGASMNATSCTQLNHLSTNQTNSTLQLGNTILDFSAINLPNKLGKAGGQLSAIIETIIVLQIVGIVSTGLLLILTPLNIFISFFRRWSIKLIIAGLAFLATGCFIFVTVVETGIHVAVKDVVNELGDGLGIEAYGGGALLALLWVKFIFMAGSSTVWFLKWHSARYVRREKEVEVKPVEPTATSNYPQTATI